MTHLQVGDSAPDFAITNQSGELIKLSDFSLFTVLDFTSLIFSWKDIELLVKKADHPKFPQ